MNAKKKHLIRRVLLFFVPIVLGLLFSYAICCFLKENGFKIDIQLQIEAVKTVIGIWGTILGFIFAAESILIAFDGSKLTEEIKETGHYKTVLFMYTITCLIFLICLVIFIPVIIINYFNWLCLFLFIAAVIVTFIDMFLCLFFLILVIGTVYR